MDRTALKLILPEHGIQITWTLHTIYSFKNYNFLKSRWNHKNWKLQQIILIKIYDMCA